MMNYLVIAVLVYLGSLAYLYFNQRNMIYYPDRSRPVPLEGITLVESAQTSDGLKLEGWYLPPPQADKPVIIFFHGNAGNIGDRLGKAMIFYEKGYGVLLAEYRGYGGNPGFPSEEGFLNDGRAWMERFRGGKHKIVLYGESLGSGVAVRMAGEYDVAGVVLESPFSSIADVAQSIYTIVPVRLLLKDHFDNVTAIGKVTAPKLFIHGARDQTIPMSFGRRLFEAANEPKTFISVDSAGHNDLYEQGAALHILDFLSTISGP